MRRLLIPYRSAWPLGGVVLLLASCATTVVPQPAARDVARATSRWPDTTLADLGRGRTLYLARCARCHQPFQPQSLPADQWPARVSEMKGRAKLQDDEADLIVRYLVTMAVGPPEHSEAIPAGRSADRRG